MTAPECDMCGHPDALPCPQFSGNLSAYCPACTATLALCDAAAAHLLALLVPQIRAWAHHWKHAGLSEQQLGEGLELIGAYWHQGGAQVGGSDTLQNARALIHDVLDGAQ